MTPNDPFQGLLQDLLKLIGGSTGGSGAWLDAARSLAYGVATDGGSEPNADPLTRIALEDIARVAELHVAEATGLALSQPPTVTPIARGAFALRLLDAWSPYLTKMVDAQRAAHGAGTAEAEGVGGAGGAEGTLGAAGLVWPPAHEPGLEELFGRFATTMGPVLMGMQFGSAAGHLAQRALGQYVITVPWPASRELLVLPDNVAHFCEEWSLPAQEARLWVCVQELTAHAVLSLPHVSERIRSLIEATTVEMVASQQGLVERLSGQADDPEGLQRLLGDPESLLADLLTPGQRRTSAELVAVSTAVSGYVDHVTRSVAARLSTSSQAIAEAWYRYRIEEASPEQAAGALFGLDTGREQIDRGAAFVRGVVERAGEEGLARLWSGRRTLPTPAELDAPGLWLERIDLPDPDDGPDAG